MAVAETGHYRSIHSAIIPDPNAKCQELHWSCMHSIGSGGIWGLGQAGPRYHLQAGISPGHSLVFPQVIRGGRNIWLVDYWSDPLQC